MAKDLNFQIFLKNGTGITGSSHFDLYLCIYNFRERMGEKWKELEKQGYTCQPIGLTIKRQP